MPLFLSQEERETLKTQHRSEHDKRICDRIKAVLLFDEGWSHTEIAHVLLLSDEERGHIEDYKTRHKLSPDHRGYPGKLTLFQSVELISHLRAHTYLYAKEIVSYVKIHFKIDYTVEGMTCWLKAHDFSYKKPAIVPGKANREAQLKWIEEYEKLKRGLSIDEAICFIDGVHPTHNTKLAYGWIPKGERKEIATNTGRQRLNISGAVDIVTKRVVAQEDVTLNALTTVELLKRIEEAYPGKKRIYVFCDNAKYYKNKDVTAHLQSSKIKMRFLPPYSPNLNPIERLWKLMNEKVLHNRYYEKFKTFKEAVMGFLQGLIKPSKEMEEILKRRITDKFQTIEQRI